MIELSVLIPTYNRPSSLNRTLESLDNQTYEKDFICLISDNNSSEETKKIVDYWTKRDTCLLYTSPSPRDCDRSRMPSSA